MKLAEFLEHLGAVAESDADAALEAVIEVESGRKTINVEPITAQFDYAEGKVVIRAEEVEDEQ